MNPKNRKEALEELRILRPSTFSISTIVIPIAEMPEDLVASLKGEGSAMFSTTRSFARMSNEAGVPTMTFLRSEPLRSGRVSSSLSASGASALAAAVPLASPMSPSSDPDTPSYFESTQSCVMRSVALPTFTPTTSSPQSVAPPPTAFAGPKLDESDPDVLIMYHQEASYRAMVINDTDMELVAIVERAWDLAERLRLAHDEVVERYWSMSDQEQDFNALTMLFQRYTFNVQARQLGARVSLLEQVARENISQDEIADGAAIGSDMNRGFLTALGAQRRRERDEEEAYERRLQEEAMRTPECGLVIPPPIDESSSALDATNAKDTDSKIPALVRTPHPPTSSTTATQSPTDALYNPAVAAKRRRSTVPNVDAVFTARPDMVAAPNGFEQSIESLFLAWLCGGNPVVFIAVEVWEEKVRTSIAAHWLDEHRIILRRHTKLLALSAGAAQALSFAEVERVDRCTMQGCHVLMLREATLVLEVLHRREREHVDFPEGLKQLKSLETREYIYCRRVVALREEAERAQRLLDDKDFMLRRIAFDETQCTQRGQFERYHFQESERVVEMERWAWYDIERQFSTEYRPARIAQLEFENRAVTLVKTLAMCEALFYPEHLLRTELYEAESGDYGRFRSLEVLSYLAARRNHLINQDVAAQLSAMDARNGISKLSASTRKRSLPQPAPSSTAVEGTEQPASQQ